jgi:Cu(I)/Ag(I) efflux system periplasmic protein CusF
MKRIFVFLAAALLALAVWAQTPAAAPAIAGEVTKLDKAGGKVTLKHGEIKHLDMPPMTMVFRVSNPKLLDEMVVGGRVRFTAEKVNGQYTVTSVSKAP